MFTMKRCPVCRVGEGFCICSLKPKVNFPFSLVILSHSEEFLKPTNTARLVKNGCPDTHILEWKRKEPNPALLKSLEDPQILSFVLNPSPEAITFEEAAFYKGQKGKEIQLILLDGTWKQSRKMFTHSTYLKSLPSLKLQPENPTEYILRRQSDRYRLSTVETVIECLKLCHDNYSARALASYFKVFQWAYMHSKTNKRIDFDPEALFEMFERVTERS